MSDSAGLTREWRGRYFEDLEVGDIFRSRLGRTITDSDNVWFTCLTLNTNQVHFNHVYAQQTLYERPLVNSTLTLALVTGLTVADTSENAAANLGWEDVRLPAPVFVGDTIWAESEILSLRASRSRPEVGIVGMRCRGINQNGTVVIEFRRSFMLYRSVAAAASFPEPRSDWTLG